MLNERVSIIDGKNPVIYVAPHGANCDDVNTAIIAEILAEKTKGYAVINRGWERSDTINYKLDKANCNNVEHCHKDVIKEEFLDPLERFKNRILKKWSRVFVLFLHGMGNDVKKRTGLDKLHYVIGWGNGKPASHTCQKWIKNFLIYNLSTVDNCTVGEGKSGGNYAGWTRNNMVQLYKKWYPDNEVDAVQIEIINKIRNNEIIATTTATIMTVVVEDLLGQDESWQMPYGFKFPLV